MSEPKTERVTVTALLKEGANELCDNYCKREVTVTGLLEEIANELCDGYCKYRDTLNEDELEERCEKCPLNKI